MRLSASRSAWQLPVQWPDGATAQATRLVVRNRLLTAAILFAMLALTVLDRFGLRLGARTGVSVGLMAMYALAAAMLLAGAARPNFRAALAYLAIVSVATLSLLVNAASAPLSFVSIGSFLLLILLYAPFCVSLREGVVVAPELWRWTVNLYIAFTVFVGVAGIVQFFVQFVFHPAWLFDYTPLIPEALRAPGSWNTDYTLGADGIPTHERSQGTWTKSNGFFMREPSFFSVVMAFGLVCELSMARRIWVMSVLGLGLVLSYSGSGLLILAVALLFPLGRATMARVLACVVLAAAVFVLFGDALNLSYTLDRSQEFVSEKSSGYCRMVAPGVEVVRQFASQPWTSLVGNGPSSMAKMPAGCASGIQTTYAKVLFEYGVVGVLAFGVLVFGALNRSSAPVRIRVAWAVGWLALTGALLDSMYLLFVYIISAMWPQDTARTLKSGALGRDAERPSLREAQAAKHGYPGPR